MSLSVNDPSLTSWVEVSKGSDFPVQNLPFGIIKVGDDQPRVASRIGEFAIDLKSMFVLGYMENLPFSLEDFDTDSLNIMMKKGKVGTRKLRERISKLFQAGSEDLHTKQHHVDQILISIDEVTMLMPIVIGDYTDFYSSEQHAYNVGCLFRDPENALMPNWKHIPVGYHGRASSIIPSGVDFHRPKGQKKPPTADVPVFGPSNLLDFELETAFFTYEGKPLGGSISTEEADDYIFGMALLNDWSARDIQGWEYVPLGPFLGKSFASHISCWIVTLDALEPFRVSGPVQDPKVLPYLEYSGDKHIAINLDVLIKPEGKEEVSVCKSNYKHMYWNMNQQLAHHSVNGCNIRLGDCMGSGTISGPNEGEYGSMLEISWKGTKPFPMPDGTERKFILDNDTVIMRGYCEKDGVRIGFGEVAAKVLPVT
ncbi:MAG: fumarylacetoacetase [Crocinitomicaceae bacterium]|nr:fumarylacetoacetase [Flavobacteriales bacterium]NQZ37577.1 fumarylacetoacetase [Crocinitomicaceae bacterium]PHR34381.1 MAG: fumarylacetoacetase [Fluviicola sp.]